MNFSSSFVITDSSPQFLQNFLVGTLPDVNKAFRASLPGVLKKTRENFVDIMTSDQVITLLMNGQFDADLGFQPGEGKSIFLTMISALANDMRINYTPLSLSGNRISGGAELYVLNEDFQVILNLPGVSRMTTGGLFPWLEWMLTQGDKIVIVGFDIHYGPFPNSRSGQAVMKADSTGFWKMPTDIAGTNGNNVFTKAITTAISLFEDYVTDVFQLELEKAL